MSTPRRLPVLLLVGLGLLAGAWWLFHVPYRAGRLYAALPVHARAAGAHERPAERWRDIIEGHWVQKLAPAWGIDPRDLDAWARIPAQHPLLRSLLRREMVWAYVSPFPGREEGSWVVASWVGGRSQVLRWMLALGFTDAVARRGVQGRTYWEWPLSDTDLKLSLVMEEGVLAACLTASPLNITHFMDGYERRFPLPEEPERWAERSGPHAPRALDRAWFRSDSAVASPRTYVAVDDLARHDTPVRVYRPGPEVAPPRLRNEDAVAVSGLFPVAPLALVAGSLREVREGITPLFPESWQELFVRVLPREAATPVFMALLDDPLHGRLFRIKVPGLVMVFRAGDPRAVLRRAEAAVERLDAETPEAAYFFKRKASPGGRAYLSLASDHDRGIFDRPSAERPALAAHGAWVLVTSSGRTMERLLDLPGENEGAAAEPLRFLEETSAAGWFDFARLAGTLRAAIKFYALKSLMGGAEEMQAAREQMRVALACLDALEPLGRGEVHVVRRGGARELRIGFDGAGRQ